MELIIKIKKYHSRDSRFLLSHLATEIEIPAIVITSISWPTSQPYPRKISNGSDMKLVDFNASQHILEYYHYG
jgi:hypothetical protein